jgi:hypothetical protein
LCASGHEDTVTLTDTRIRNAKPRATAYKLGDGGGMYLLVTPDGARYWRMDYRFAGKRRTLALGVYPIVTLSNARTHREHARLLLAQNVDPSAAKRRPSASPSSRARTRSKRSRGNGLQTSVTDYLRDTAACSLRGLMQIYFHELAHDRLPI